MTDTSPRRSEGDEAAAEAEPDDGTAPGVVVGVLGTGTEVGKTWVGAAVLSALRAAGVAVAARKPAQSAEPDDPGPSDAAVLAGSTGEDEADVCPAHRRYRVAMAPPMAAAATGEPGFTVADLAAEVAWPPGTEVGLVETAGGSASPAADDGDSVDLLVAVDVDRLVLVADAGLGTLNGVRLTVADLAARSVTTPLTVHLNRYDDAEPLHRANAAWLRTREGLDVVTDVEALAAALRGGRR